MCCSAAVAAASSVRTNCTKTAAKAADAAIDDLENWAAVYRFYKRFGRCYDASIAEGVNDKVQLLWANHWETLPNMLAYTANDSGFKKLAWRIVRSDDFPQDAFTVVLKHATQNCPMGGTSFCRTVKATAQARVDAQPVAPADVPAARR